MEALKYVDLPPLTVFNVCIGSALTIVTFLSYYGYRHSYWKRHGIAGPRPFPVVGTVFTEILNGRAKLFVEWREQYGRIFGTYNGTNPTLVVGDAEIIRQILIKDSQVFPNHTKLEFPSRVGKDMLIFMRDFRWKSLRSLMAFSMTSGKIKGIYPLVMEATDEMLDSVSRVAKHVDSPVLDVKTVYLTYTLNMIARAGFAMRFSTGEKEKQHRQELVAFLLKYTGRILWTKIMMFMLMPKLVLRAIGFHMGDDVLDVKLEKLCNQIINSRRKLGDAGRHNDMMQTLLDLDATRTGLGSHLLEQTANNDKESHHVSSADQEELDILLSSKTQTNKDLANVADNYGSYNKTNGNSDGQTNGEAKLKLNDKEIVANSILLLVAGYETTSTLLTFATHLLAHHTEAQEKLCQEVGDSKIKDDMFSYERIIALPYLDAVISESLRLYPPAVATDRQANEDYHIKSLSLTIRKNQTILVPIFSVHRDPQYYEQPDVFIPERFLPENRHKLTPYTYLPFGAGIRHCLGMRFALAEAKLALARLVYNFKFSPAPGSDYPPKLGRSLGLLKSENILVTVSART